jgi:4-amino-4-deoxy-L-arabinose transferase-like glycosyltransferase
MALTSLRRTGAGGQSGPSPRERSLRAAVLVLLIAVSGFLLLRGLGSASFWSSDEALYGQVAREMLATGDPLDLRYQGEPFHHKPPLGIWMTAAGRALISPDELGSRLPFALAGILLVAAVALTGFRLGGWAAGLLAGLLLILGQQVLYEHGLRSAVFEAPLVLLTFGTLIWGLRAPEGRRFAVGAGLCLGAAALLKPPVAVLPALAVAIHLAATDRRVLASRGSLAGGLALAVSLPWHLQQLLTHGAAFWDTYVVYEFLGRAGSTATVRSPGRLVHLEALWANFHVWCVPIAAALIWAFATRRRERMALAAYVAGFLALLCFVPGKWPWYGLPVYPVLAVLAGSFAAWLAARRPRAAVIAAGVLAAARWSLLSWNPGYAPTTRVSVAWPEETRMLEWLGGPSAAALAVSAAALIAAGAGWWAARQYVSKSRLAALALALAALGLLRDGIDVASVPVGGTHPAAAMSRAIERAGPSSVLAWGFAHAPRYGDRMEPRMLYYLDGAAPSELVDLDRQPVRPEPRPGRFALVLDERGLTAAPSDAERERLASLAASADVWLYHPSRGLGFTRSQELPATLFSDVTPPGGPAPRADSASRLACAPARPPESRPARADRPPAHP